MKNFKWQEIIAWFDAQEDRHFLWRNYDLPLKERLYHVWLAEILLQQTQAERVVPFYQKILTVYPTIEALAATTYETFFEYYQGLGYYSRARNLLKTAQQVTLQHGGIFPEDLDALKQLPGIGEYTTRAILAFGYGKSCLAWDTNLHTIFARYYHGNKHHTLSMIEKKSIEADFINFVNQHNISLQPHIIRNINNGLMDWARTMEPKHAGLLDMDSYLFKESLFFVSKGSLESRVQKTRTSFPLPDASIIVILHKDHKVYYGGEVLSTLEKDTDKYLGERIAHLLDSSDYRPFVLPPALHRNTRKYVQGWFEDLYNLQLSVRPVHKKWLSDDGKPFVAVNAQIQLGNDMHFKKYYR